MRSQFNNKQKLNSIKQELLDYVQNVKNENDRLYALIAQDQFNFARHDWEHYREQYFKDGKIVIIRRELKSMILKRLDYSSANSITTFIDKLLGTEILSLNPTSSLSIKKGIYMPTPDSRYFINENKLFGSEGSLLNFG